MADHLLPIEDIEPDRFELHEPVPYAFTVSRRTFLETVGAGVIIMVVLPGRRVWAELPGGQQQINESIGAWLHLTPDGRVTVYTGKVEVGQDIRTSLTQAVADELRVSPAVVGLIMGDTDLVPFDAGTFGSRSTPQMGTQLRRAAAAARAIVLQRAAERWATNVASLTLADGIVIDQLTKQSMRMGEVIEGEKLVETITADAKPMPPDQWTTSGKSLPKVKGPDIVRGRHRYTTDLRFPNMLIGRVLRAPANGASLISADVTAARALPNVVVVHDGPFVGVAAPDAATADRALALIKAEWKTTPQPSHREIFEHLKRTSQAGRPTQRGSIDEGLAAADEKLEATYTTAYIAHVPLEPRAAVADWRDGRLWAWTGTQRPFGVRAELARAFSLTETQVRVFVPDTGSGYGGKHTGECAIEAARLAQAAKRPVKLVWSREEEFAWAYFRPAALIEIKAGAKRDGTLTAWEFHDYNAGASALRSPYDVPNISETYHPSETPLRQGSYRGLAATANNFAREAHLDELAARIGMDPLAFRIRNLRDERLAAVLRAAADKFGWTQWQPAPNRGIGLAIGTEKGGYIATCVELESDRTTGAVKLLRITAAFECGAIVNPDGLLNQVEGGIVMGLGGALWEAIEFENGRILNPRLSQYRVPRLSDVPPIDTVLVDRRDLPSAGSGETPIIALAPAIANAIARASGERLRSLPLAPRGSARPAP